MKQGAVMLKAHPDLTSLQVHLFGLALGCATGVDFVASSMMGVAGTHIRAGVFASPEDFLWSLTSYAAAAVVANLVLRRIAEDISYRGYTLLSLAVAAAGALLCALCETPFQLSLARAVQGLGAGGLFSASRIIIQLAAEREERRPLFLGFNIGALGMPALAPWVTAQLVQNTDWRTIFLLQAALALATFAFVLAAYPRRMRATLPPWKIEVGKLDWLTVILLGAGALILLHGLGDLRFYEFANSPSVALTPLLGLACVAAVFVHQHRHPDPWLNPRLLLGRRYIAGLSFYALYYFLGGLWGYVVPTTLQSGLDFTFQTAGAVLTTTGLAGFGAALLFTFGGPKLVGQRRYIALGYLMFAGAAWLLSQRMMPGASIAVLLPALTLQSLTVPFVLMLVAGLTYADLSVDSFAHAYQFKNIVRQVATAGGTGMASLWLQYGEVMARTQLVGNITPFAFAQEPDQGTLLRLSRQIDQQALLIASGNLFALLAVACVVIALVAVVQRSLR
ncbi:MFS transporter [Cupriavidus sp. USMAHM13]|uniref:MFS transporter n=1 Tax=Cupriavidus malaysiensis TaxID=367825 RepID=A0ABN4TU40_9BURK|nr:MULTISPECIES: MFS transporter [Cupriavidus]AOZ02790.1 MFS transporter [Cupriavidus sp. USMAHM13]AOZ09836.1 MFS transporter [Cupriavidus malaysiensis]